MKLVVLREGRRCGLVGEVNLGRVGSVSTHLRGRGMIAELRMNEEVSCFWISV
jgi:hypothetical protein